MKIIKDKLQGEPPSKAIWYGVKRDDNGNAVMYPYVKNKWIYDNIGLLKQKYEKTDNQIDISIHYILRSEKKVSELLASFEFILLKVFINNSHQIRNITITKEVSELNNDQFKACIQEFQITIL
jgi:hypothetical protein